MGDFESAEDFRRYSAHPSHVEVLNTCIKPILKAGARVQREINGPPRQWISLADRLR